MARCFFGRGGYLRKRIKTKIVALLHFPHFLSRKEGAVMDLTPHKFKTTKYAGLGIYILSISSANMRIIWRAGAWF